MINTNFEVGSREFGFNALSRKLETLLGSYTDEIKASRRRLEKSKTNYAV